MKESQMSRSLLIVLKNNLSIFTNVKYQSSSFSGSKRLTNVKAYLILHVLNLGLQVFEKKTQLYFVVDLSRMVSLVDLLNFRQRCSTTQML